MRLIGPLVDHLEFYLLNYFKPGHDVQTNSVRDRATRYSVKIGCASCHVPTND